MKLTIHIGLHKSGSTAIQKFSAASDSALAEASVLYPVGLFETYPDQHSELLQTLKSSQEGALEAVFEEIVRRGRKAGRDHIFLSGEDLCSGATDALTDKLSTEAAKHFSDMRVVLVVRNKTDYMVSHYNHFLRHWPRGVALADFRSRLAFDPDETVHRWARSFGEANIITIPYNAPDGRELVERFFQRIFGITPTPEALLACKGTNASFDMISSYLINEALKVRPGFNLTEVNAVYRKAFQHRHPRLPFFDADTAALMDCAAPQDTWSEVGSISPSSRAEPARALTPHQAEQYLTGLAKFLRAFVDLPEENWTPPSGTDTLSDKSITELYRATLDRNPESDAVIQKAKSYRDRSGLRAALFASPEFRRKSPKCIRLNVVPLDAPALQIRSTRSKAKLNRLFAHIQERWTQLGKDKAHWSVLSSPKYQGDIDPAVEAAFYKTGEIERAVLTRILERASQTAADFEHAFEFGCGLGRLSVQLSEMFPKVTACDISANHLAGARSAAERLGQTNIDFVHGSVPDFGMTRPFDFWYSRIVLQHNPPPLIEAILRQALDLLQPGGLAVFQVPTYSVGYSFDIDDYLKKQADGPEIEMHCLPQPAVFEIIRQTGCGVVEVREDTAVEIPHYWVSNTFVVRK